MSKAKFQDTPVEFRVGIYILLGYGVLIITMLSIGLSERFVYHITAEETMMYYPTNTIILTAFPIALYMLFYTEILNRRMKNQMVN